MHLGERDGEYKKKKDRREREFHLLNAPLSLEELEVTFNHLKLNIAPFTEGQILNFFLVTVNDTFGFEF